MGCEDLCQIKSKLVKYIFVLCMPPLVSKMASNDPRYFVFMSLYNLFPQWIMASLREQQSMVEVRVGDFQE